MQEKKSDTDPVEKLLNDLKRDIEGDRAKLTKVLDALIEYGGEDGNHMVAVAETAAKIADSLTKQNQLRVAAIKAIGRRNMRDEEEDMDPFDDIGSAFESHMEEN